MRTQKRPFYYMENKIENRWNKYNIKSLKFPKGKEESMYYEHLLKQFSKVEADIKYKRFKYNSTHGQNG